VRSGQQVNGGADEGGKQCCSQAPVGLSGMVEGHEGHPSLMCAFVTQPDEPEMGTFHGCVSMSCSRNSGRQRFLSHTTAQHSSGHL
jgi:hypothetical protein